MKTYVITLSAVFPKTHSRAGQPTDFAEKFRKTKLHTIRANYPLWFKRFEQIDDGEACLSVRQWTGLPYRSKQIEIARLTKDDGISLQRLDFTTDRDGNVLAFFRFSDAIQHIGKFHHPAYPTYTNLANNDGLSLADWREWFKGYDLTKPLAVIQFTKFKY